jgi:2-iminobutanoate/2-iminopropanoate deaminase
MRRVSMTTTTLIGIGLLGVGLGVGLSAGQAIKDHTRINVMPQLPGAGTPPYSNAVMAGDTLYLSGTVGNDPKTGKPPEVFADAVQQAIANQTAALKAAGLTWADVVKVNVYVKDMAKYGEFNKIYMEALPKPYPARTFIAVADLPANGQVEIEGIAVRKR